MTLDETKIKEVFMSELGSLRDALEKHSEQSQRERQSMVEECMQRLGQMLDTSMAEIRMVLDETQGEVVDLPVPSTTPGQEEPSMSRSMQAMTTSPESRAAYYKKRTFHMLEEEASLADQIVRRARTWWRNLREPKRRGPLANFINSTAFNAFIASAIAINAIQAVVQVNADMVNKDFSTKGWAIALDGFFLAIFTIELVLRLLVHHHWLFISKGKGWVWFDVFLLITGYLGWTLSLQSDASGALGNVTSLRILRNLRVFKVLRILRFVKLFRQADLLNSAVMATLEVLLLAVVAMVLFMLLISTFLMQGIGNYMEDRDWSAPERIQEDVETYFSSVGTTLLTLFKVILGGIGWSEILKVLSRIGFMQAFIFVFYLLFYHLLFFHVITGMVVLQMQTIAQPDEDADRLERRHTDFALASELEVLFSKALKNRTIVSSPEEMHELMTTPAIQEFFRQNHLTPADADLWWHTAVTITREGVSVGELSKGILNMHGYASSFDVHMNMLALEKTLLSQKSINRDMKLRIEMLQRVLQLQQMRSEDKQTLLATKSTTSFKKRQDSASGMTSPRGGASPSRSMGIASAATGQLRPEANFLTLAPASGASTPGNSEISAVDRTTRRKMSSSSAPGGSNSLRTASDKRDDGGRGGAADSAQSGKPAAGVVHV